MVLSYCNCLSFGMNETCKLLLLLLLLLLFHRSVVVFVLFPFCIPFCVESIPTQLLSSGVHVSKFT